MSLLPINPLMRELHEQKLYDGSEDLRLIGGVIGLEDGSDESGPFFEVGTDRATFLANASSALFLLVERLRPPRVWLPSYLCESLCMAVGRAAINFYEVDSELEAGSSWIEELHADDLVVVIHYFGFTNPLANMLRSRK